MKEKDIAVGQDYAVVAHPRGDEWEARLGRVVETLGHGRYKVRFRQRLATGAYYFYFSETGEREHELDADCFISTWADRKARENAAKLEKERLADSLEDVRKLIEGLETTIQGKGLDQCFRGSVGTEWDQREEVPVARLTVSRDTLATIIEALERLDGRGADEDVFSQLLGGD